LLTARHNSADILEIMQDGESTPQNVVFNKAPMEIVEQSP